MASYPSPGRTVDVALGGRIYRFSEPRRLILRAAAARMADLELRFKLSEISQRESSLAQPSDFLAVNEMADVLKDFVPCMTAAALDDAGEVEIIEAYIAISNLVADALEGPAMKTPDPALRN